MNLEKELDYLNQTLFKMSDVVVENMTEAMAFYLGKKDTVTINDDLVDHYERLVEELCLMILLKERPYAKDLKEVTGILKLVADIERIGDHAEDIYEFALKLVDCKEKRFKEIDSLFDFVIQMLKDSIHAYIRKDLSLAEKVIASDDFVDRQYEDLLARLVSYKIGENADLSFAIYTTLVVKYLERIADHCVNVAEWVIYMANGFHKDKKIC